MGKAKKYAYDYDDEFEGKAGESLVQLILDDPEFPQVTELIIGNWAGAWEEDCQDILDKIVEHADKFSHVESLFVGDMEGEECEVSWILQGNYSSLWAALPNLKELVIKGSQDLELGDICHENLESLEIICGGLPSSVIESIRQAKLPNLKTLYLYIGIDNYGFDGDADTIRRLLEEADFPKLEHLGIVDSEIQDELTEVVLNSKFMSQIRKLSLSDGTLSDKGGELLAEKIPLYPNIQSLDLHHHFMSDEMVKKLQTLSVELDVSDQEEPDNYRGEIWMYASLTE